MLKKILKISFVLLLVSTVTLLVSVRFIMTGASGLDDWVMRQVLGVVQTYLVPTIEFDRFIFSPPRTVHYHGVKLIAPDGTPVIDADELTITLEKIPRRGEPVVIQDVTIRNGSLNLIATPDDPKTTFKGLAPFVKTDNIKKQEELPSEVRLSDTLDLRSVTLDNASIVYDPGDGQSPMRLDGLTLTMAIEPVENTGDDTGGVWHRIDLDIDRGDLFRLSIDGQMNLDELSTELDALKIMVDVGSESVGSLPPQIQQLLAGYEASGNLGIELAGSAKLNEWRQSEFGGEISLRQFNFALGEYRLQIDNGMVPIKVGGGAASVGPARFEMLKGVLLGTLNVDLQEEALRSIVEWSIAEIDLRELFRTASSEGTEPKLAGIFSSFGSATMDFSRIPESIDGRGEIHIADGNLINLPGVRELNNVLNIVNSVRGNEYEDRYDIEFSLTGQGALIEKSKLETNALIARSTGMVYYDGRLDLRLNAGPLEKIENVFGEIGAAIGRVFEKVIEYRVTGTLSDPKVQVRPLGIGN